MNITVKRTSFLAAFQAAALVAPKRSPKPILQSVKLSAGKERSTLSATDLEIGLEVTLDDIDVKKDGVALLPVDSTMAILRESSDEEISIQMTPKGITVKGSRSKFDLPTEDPGEFPAIKPFAAKDYHTIKSVAIKTLIHRTAYATDNESSRYALGGVLLEAANDDFTMVATDGRRLCLARGTAVVTGKHNTTSVNTILPVKALRLIERELKDDDSDVKIAAGNNEVHVASGDFTIYTRLVEGRFPRWRDVIPARDEESVAIELAVGPFKSALRQAMVTISGDSKGVDFVFDEGILVLSARAVDKGESRVELPIANSYKRAVMLDPKFLVQFLETLEPDAVVTAHVRDAETAVLLESDENYRYVVMPLAREQG